MESMIIDGRSQVRPEMTTIIPQSVYVIDLQWPHMVKSQLGWFLCESKGKSFDLSLESLLFWVQSGNKVYFQITKCILTPLYVTEKLIVLLGANERTYLKVQFNIGSLKLKVWILIFVTNLRRNA